MPKPTLPQPLTEALLDEALQELPRGARLATETCYSCWKSDKFPTPEFLSFLRSISGHSKILAGLFAAADGEGLMESEPAGSSARHQKFTVSPELQEAAGASTADTFMDPMEEVLMSPDAPNSTDNETDRIQHERRLMEVQRRRLEQFRGGSYAERSTGFLKYVLTKFKQELPKEGQSELLKVIKRYMADNSSDEQRKLENLAQEIQKLVDEHNVMIPLVYNPHRSHGGNSDGKKRPIDKGEDTKPSNSAAPGPQTKAKKKSTGGSKDGGDSSSQASASEEKDLSDEELTLLCKQLNRQLGAFAQVTTCEDLQDTPLGMYLTTKARQVCQREVVVKLVADVLKSPHHPGSKSSNSAGLPCRSKAIFAFQRVDDGPHFVLCFGMYVHEYGPGCPPQHAGRVYIECVDSVPLYGKEKGEERQTLLSHIVLGYFDYVRSMGFKFAHMRVPPPTDESSHIFASRSLIVRLRASLHLAHWYKRLLSSAQQSGVISGYEAGQTGNLPNFPLSLLQPGEMAAELAFRNIDASTLDAQAQQLMGRVTQLKERFFVLSLQQPNSSVPHAPDVAPLLPSAVASDKNEFVGVCVSQRLRFATVQQAKYATMMLVHRMMAKQARSFVRPFEEAGSPAPTGSYPGHQAGNSSRSIGSRSLGSPAFEGSESTASTTSASSSTSSKSKQGSTSSNRPKPKQFAKDGARQGPPIFDGRDPRDSRSAREQRESRDALFEELQNEMFGSSGPSFQGRPRAPESGMMHRGAAGPPHHPAAAGGRFGFFPYPNGSQELGDPRMGMMPGMPPGFKREPGPDRVTAQMQSEIEAWESMRARERERAGQMQGAMQGGGAMAARSHGPKSQGGAITDPRISAEMEAFRAREAALGPVSAPSYPHHYMQDAPSEEFRKMAMYHANHKGGPEVSAAGRGAKPQPSGTAGRGRPAESRGGKSAAAESSDTSANDPPAAKQRPQVRQKPAGTNVPDGQQSGSSRERVSPGLNGGGKGSATNSFEGAEAVMGSSAAAARFADSFMVDINDSSNDGNFDQSMSMNDMLGGGQDDGGLLDGLGHSPTLGLGSGGGDNDDLSVWY